MTRCNRFIACSAVLLCSALPATAQNVTVGAGATGNNIYPFVVYSGRYQQLFSASSFTNAIFINALQFHPASGFSSPFGITGADPFDITSANYRISFSTTSTTTSTISRNFNANVGSPLASFFAGPFVSGGLVVTGSTPYLYDPTQGNLLLDVVVGSVIGPMPFPKPLAFTESHVMARVFLRGGTGPEVGVGQSGLETTFVATIATPEPASLVLLGAGLVGILAVARRKHAA